MKKFLFIFSIVCFSSMIFSCKKKMLDLTPQDRFNDDAVWNRDPAMIQAFVNNIYNGLGQNGIRIMMGAFVDEFVLVHGWGTEDVTKSLITPSSINASFGADNNFLPQSKYYKWEIAYKNIRACNVFLKNIETAEAVDAEQKKALSGEVHFLRAYLYHMLVSIYGGVPIITEPYSLNEDYEVARNTFEECIQFISDECDKAAAMVSDNTQKGRPTKGAALALKARVLLHAASDLYNSNGSWAGEYAHPELIGYTGGDRAARWQVAKDAAKAVIDLGVYQLYKGSPAPGDDIAKNYGEIFLLKETSEDIFVRYTLQSVAGTAVMPNLNNAPNGYYGRGSNTPIGQLVDEYEMNDGTKFSWSNPAHATNPYANREPRFYASILYDGADWRERPADVAALDPEGIIQTGNTERWNNSTNSVELVYGLDTRKSPIYDWVGTYTGYYLKKGMDPSYNPEYENAETPWRFIRYAEVILNYAEACLGLGQEAEARTYINMIRKRAGLPDITETGQALVDRYRHERRIELAFEDHRFFDVRRWMIAPDVYRDAEGISILHKLNPDHVTTTPIYTVLPSVQQRAWLPQFYFLPIFFEEMNRNSKLVQNPLY